LERRRRGLTDDDVLALLLREPFGGITPELYARLSDYQVTEIYFAPRDKDLNLIPFYERLADREQQEEEQAEPVRSPTAGLGTVEELGVPQEMLLKGIPMDFVLLFYRTWRDRGKTAEWVTERFGKYIRNELPEQHGVSEHGNGTQSFSRR